MRATYCVLVYWRMMEHPTAVFVDAPTEYQATCRGIARMRAEGGQVVPFSILTDKAYKDAKTDYLDLQVAIWNTPVSKPAVLPAMKDIGSQLFTMGEKENQGRGVVCVRTIATYLMRGEWDDAVAVWHTDGDKIRQYPTLETFILHHLGCRAHGRIGCADWPCKEPDPLQIGEGEDW